MPERWFAALQPFTFTWQEVHLQLHPRRHNIKTKYLLWAEKAAKTRFPSVDDNKRPIQIQRCCHCTLCTCCFILTSSFRAKLHCNGCFLYFHQQKGSANWVDLRRLSDNNSFAIRQSDIRSIHPPGNPKSSLVRGSANNSFTNRQSDIRSTPSLSLSLSL